MSTIAASPGPMLAGSSGEEPARDNSRRIQLAFLIGFLLVWWLVTALALINPFFLPSPQAVARVFFRLVTTGEILPDLKITTGQIAVSFPIALLSGLAVGYAVSSSRYSVEVFEPMLAGLFAIPLIIFYPLNVLILGIGPESKIAHGAIYGFFPIVLSAIQGFGSVDRAYLRSAHSLGASRFQVLRRVLLPAALPSIMAGVRMGFVLTFVATIGSETIASLGGLGHRIVWYAESLETDKMFAYIVFIIIIAVVSNAVLSWIERRSDWR